MCQNLFNRAKLSRVNSKPFQNFRLDRVTEVYFPSKDEEPEDIGHTASMLLDTGKSNCESR